MNIKQSLFSGVSAAGILLGAALAPQTAQAWISGAIVGGAAGAVSGAVSGGVSGAAIGGASGGALGGAAGGAAGTVGGGVNGAIGGGILGLLNPVPFVPVGSLTAGNIAGTAAGAATGAVAGSIGGIAANVPAVAADRLRWDAQNTVEGANKGRGAIADKGKGIIGWGGVIGRQGQILVETAEKIAHDRAIATKGYTDRAVTEGINTAEKRVKENVIGDIGSVAEEMGVEGTAGGQWRTNKSGQVIGADNKPVRLHDVVNRWEAKGLLTGADMSALKAVDGYFTVDKNGNLVAHNATGGTIWQPGEATKIGAHVNAVVAENILGGFSAAWKTGADGQERVRQFLKEKLGLTITQDGHLMDKAGKAMGKIADLNDKGSDFYKKADKWIAERIGVIGEDAVKAHEGAWQQGKDATVSDIMKEQNKNIAENDRRLGDLGTVDEKVDGDIMVRRDKTVKEYTEGRLGDLGAEPERDASGAIVLDEKGKALPKAQPYDGADNGKATVKDYADIQRAEATAQGKAYVDGKFTDMDKRFDTTVKQGKAYVDNMAQQTLKSANDYTDGRFNRLDGKIKKLRARADSGIAGATAIASLPFDSTPGKSGMAGGLGVAKNKVAGAVGFQHNFNNQWRARATVSVSDNYVQGGAGIGYSW